MNPDTRIIEAAHAVELYITAVPPPGCTPQEQAEHIYTQIRDLLRRSAARIFQERIFAGQEQFPPISAIRKRLLGDLDDGAPPARLTVRPGAYGRFAGVQVHAVRGENRPEVLEGKEGLCGRILRCQGNCYVSASALSAPQAGESGCVQARAMLEKAEALLAQAGGDMRCVIRTWMWLRDILTWYGEFNEVRNRFFRERGLAGEHANTNLPASTGIGLGSADGACCAMDLLAMVGPNGIIEHRYEIGNQRSAFNYGSAFSRASVAPMPAGRTVFVSGTAAIDCYGATQHAGDAARQIAATIDNVQAVLRDLLCGEGDIVQAIAYCKTPEVEEVFRRQWGALSWPLIVGVADVCRDELLFEIEAAAVPGARMAFN